MELIGKGPGSKGIVWVAARVPEGCITAHANMSRITTFPLDDPENWLLFARRRHVRDREGILQDRLGQAVQLPRRLSSRHRRLAEAGLRRAGLEHLPPFRGIPAELLRRLLPRARRAPRTIRCSSSPTSRWRSRRDGA